jgi:SWI/SNF-related matrix-associated actin-dependent regulator of chromatin subfamily A containing DEAD/H box 1
MLPQLVSEGHRILLFSQWKMNLDILQCLLEALGLKYHRLDGDLKVNERMEIIDSFNNDLSFKVFLLSTRAGGMGINLTSADTCIIHDCDFNPTMDQQAEDRCHRIGQKKPVTVYKLVCEGTVDEGIYNLAVRKMAANKAILNDEQGKGGQAASKGNDKKDISMLVSEAFQKFYETENAKGSIGGIVKAAEAEVSSVPAPVANEKVINLDHSDSDDGCNRKSAQDKNTFFSEDSDSD